MDENINSTYEIPDRLSQYGPILKFWFIFLEPWFIIGGILGNIAILCVMPLKSVNIRWSMKIYYLTIAFFDLYNIINSWVMWTTINDTLCVLTNCQIFFPLTATIDLACKIIFTGWTVAEIMSNYTLVTMLFEKTLVVMYPLKAKSFVNTKFRIILFSIFVFPPVLAVSPFNPFVAAVLKPKFKQDYTHCYYDTYHPLYEYVFWSTHIFMFGIHEVLSCILSAILALALLHQVRQRTKLIHKQITDTKEMGTIITILILGVINFLNFIPVTFLTFAFFMIDSSNFSDQINALLDDLWGTAYQGVIVAHAINFPLYFLRIEQFRTVFTGRFKKAKLDTRSTTKPQ